MAYEIIFAPAAIEDIRRLRADDRSSVIAAIETHLRHQPRKGSKSRIKGLRGLRQPEYRLRVDNFRIDYDVAEPTIRVLSVIAKHMTYDWLKSHGTPL
jgi:mRNA-degrading endonuclease RelE of RelBE toxin-antitoxin system